MVFIGALFGLCTITLPALVQCIQLASTQYLEPKPRPSAPQGRNAVADNVGASSFMAPTGLLSQRSHRRPGWGRDYGPDLGLPKEVSANPFGDKAPGNPQKPGPENKPLHDNVEKALQVKDPKAKPKFQHDKVPESPGTGTVRH